MNRLSMLALVALAPLVLAGCYEDVTPTRYEPGTYKGADDPLHDQLESEELRTQLDERFARVAEDR